MTGAVRPRVSVTIPVFNGERHVAEAIQSVLDQTFRDFELIVCDNASEDATEEICRAFAAKDARIRYIRHAENLGAAANFNHAFALATGTYFQWLSFDDLLAPEYLETCLAAFAHAPDDVVLVVPRRRYIDQQGRPLEQPPDWDARTVRPRASNHRITFSELMWGGGEAFPFTFALLKRSAVERTRLMGNYFGADAAFVAEMRLLGQFWEVPQELFFQRIHYGLPEQELRKTLRGWMLWFDPANANRPTLPAVQLFVAHMTAIHRTPLPVGQKLAAYAAMGGYVASRVRRLFRPGALDRVTGEIGVVIEALRYRLGTAGSSSGDASATAPAAREVRPPKRPVASTPSAGEP